MNSIPYFADSGWTAAFPGTDYSTNAWRDVEPTEPGKTWPVNYEGVDAVDTAQRIRLWEGVDRFIDEMKREATSTGVPSYIVASKAEGLWMATHEEYTNLPIPVVSLGTRGGIQFGWWIGEYEVELEIFSDHLELVVCEPGQDPIEESVEGNHNPLEYVREHLDSMLVYR